MTRHMIRAALVAACMALSLTRIPAATAQPEMLARFPSGTFLENLVLRPDGSVVFTNYFARGLEAWAPATGHRRFVDVPAHPVSLTVLPGDRLALVAHGTPFTTGPAAMRGAAILLVLGPDGTLQRRIPLPDAVFPNGGVLLPPDRLLVADSALGRIWQVDLASGAVATWLDHPLLAPVDGSRAPGVNGLKRDPRGAALLISNSARRSLLRVALDAGGNPAGVPALVAEMPTGIDDFDVAGDGTVYAATHRRGLAVLPQGGTPRLIDAPGVEGSTAVLLSVDGTALFALGTGGMLEGLREEAVLARLPVPP